MLDSSVSQSLSCKSSSTDAAAVKQQIDRGIQLEDIDVDFRLTVLKPLHAQWMVNMFNYFTTDKGKEQMDGKELE